MRAAALVTALLLVAARFGGPDGAVSVQFTDVTVKTGSSYLSQSELPLTFGLGKASKITGIEVTWPTGRTERFPGIAPNQAITILEGKGIIRSVSIGSAP